VIVAIVIALIVIPPSPAPKTISLYAPKAGSVIAMREGTVCTIEISHGGHASMTDAQKASPNIRFLVTLNGNELPGSGTRGYISEPGQWHITQQFKTPPLTKGIFQVRGISFEKNERVDQRSFAIRVD